MSHQMTALDAENALYREAAWHRLGTVGPIDWEEARHALIPNSSTSLYD